MLKKLVGTRPASQGTWGRKFSLEVRELCKEASVARPQFIKARREGPNFGDFLEKWQNLRSSFIRAWERSDMEYHTKCIDRTVAMGSNTVWR